MALPAGRANPFVDVDGVMTHTLSIITCYNARFSRDRSAWARRKEQGVIFMSTHTPLTILSEDEELFRDSIRGFAEEQIKPIVHKMDEEAKLEHSLIPELFKLGLMGIHVPEGYGGGEGSFFMSVLAVEEISRIDASFGVFIDVQNTLVNNAIMRWANDEQKRRYLTKLAKDTVGAYALSEAGSGSDAFALGCRAVDQGDHFIINGRKLWITNAL